MFSQRTEWNFERTPLTLLADEKRSRGEPLIDLTLSNPTTCGIQFELPFDDFQFFSLPYDPHPAGIASAREAVSEFYRRRGSNVHPESVILTASTSEAYSFLFRLLCDPGDEILLPRPGYPLFHFLCQLNDISPVYYRLEYDGEWHIDTQSVTDNITRRTRAAVILHPHNPTGCYVKDSEKTFFQKIARSHCLPLIVDEVFFPFSFVEENQRANLLIPSDHLMFTLNGLSKLAALPSMKLSWIVTMGPGNLVDKALQRLEVIADTALSVATPIQHLLPEILSHSDRFTVPLLERVKENLRHLGSALAGSPASLLHTEGGWNAILRLSGTRSDEAWCLDILERFNVLVHPGSLFDMGPEQFMVVSLLPPPQEFKEGITRLLRLL